MRDTFVLSRSGAPLGLFHPRNIVGKVQNLLVGDRGHHVGHAGIITVARIVLIAT